MRFQIFTAHEDLLQYFLQSVFVPILKFAQIRDFTPKQDKIRLPGSSADYVTTSYDGDGTAILYTESPNINVSVGIGPFSIGGASIALEPPDNTILVAVVDGVSIRNLTDSDF